MKSYIEYITLPSDNAIYFPFELLAIMSDFILTDDDDLDLSKLLGEFTEYEVEFDSDSWSDENPSTSKMRKQEETRCQRKRHQQSPDTSVPYAQRTTLQYRDFAVMLARYTIVGI